MNSAIWTRSYWRKKLARPTELLRLVRLWNVCTPSCLSSALPLQWKLFSKHATRTQIASHRALPHTDFEKVELDRYSIVIGKKVHEKCRREQVNVSRNHIRMQDACVENKSRM